MKSNYTRSIVSRIPLAFVIIALTAGLRHSPILPAPIALSSSYPVRLPPEQASALAVNDLEATADGYRLRHPRHTAEFRPDGVRFTPGHGGPEWAWQLTFVGVNDGPLSAVNVGAVKPVHGQPGVIAYPRGAVIEQYLAQTNTLEQRFILPSPLSRGSADLVIAGRVTSTGEFETSAEEGWVWRAGEGVVRLGNVRVYDAAGRALSADMRVTASATQIVVDGIALARAAYPVTIDPEIGTDDFRISDMGTDGDASRDALDPAVAYNSSDNEYFVVWSGDEGNDDEFEIRGQRIDAVTGDELGTNDIVLTSMGPSGDISYTASSPAVAYNSVNNEYLVVWSGDDNTSPLVEGEFEIFGQRVDATGAGVGNNDFRLSDMGPNGSTGYDAYSPAVTYNSASNEYLVVWRGDDDTSSLVSEEYEIYYQRVYGNLALGDETGTNDVRLSEMGPDGDTDYDAYAPAVVYNSANSEYLVVWQGDDDTAPLVNEEFEIFGQRLSAAGTQQGIDFRISAVGPDGDANYDAGVPAAAYNNRDNEYLVVWPGVVGFDIFNLPYYQIFGQRLDAATGAEAGINDFQISDNWGPITSPGSAGFNAVSYNSASNEYLVIWRGINHPLTLEHGHEIYAQRISATGAEINDDVQLSRMGGYGTTYEAYNPAIGYNITNNEYLAVWYGDDDTGALVDEEFEIYGQRYTLVTPVFLPLVFRNYPPCFSGPGEVEPNNDYTQANGPLCLSITDYTGYHNGATDDRDYFKFNLTAAGTITLQLLNYVDTSPQITLYDQSGTTSVGFAGGPPYSIVYSGPAGTYYARVYTIAAYDPNAPYTLRVSVTYP
jgi:hypothetical protein